MSQEAAQARRRCKPTTAQNPVHLFSDGNFRNTFRLGLGRRVAVVRRHEDRLIGTLTSDIIVFLDLPFEHSLRWLATNATVHGDQRSSLRPARWHIRAWLMLNALLTRSVGSQSG